VALRNESLLASVAIQLRTNVWGDDQVPPGRRIRLKRPAPEDVIVSPPDVLTALVAFVAESGRREGQRASLARLLLWRADCPPGLARPQHLHERNAPSVRTPRPSEPLTHRACASGRARRRAGVRVHEPCTSARCRTSRPDDPAVAPAAGGPGEDQKRCLLLCFTPSPRRVADAQAAASNL